MAPVDHVPRNISKLLEVVHISDLATLPLSLTKWQHIMKLQRAAKVLIKDRLQKALQHQTLSALFKESIIQKSW